MSISEKKNIYNCNITRMKQKFDIVFLIPYLNFGEIHSFGHYFLINSNLFIKVNIKSIKICFIFN